MTRQEYIAATRQLLNSARTHEPTAAAVSGDNAKLWRAWLKLVEDHRSIEPVYTLKSEKVWRKFDFWQEVHESLAIQFQDRRFITFSEWQKITQLGAELETFWVTATLHGLYGREQAETYCRSVEAWGKGLKPKEWLFKAVPLEALTVIGLSPRHLEYNVESEMSDAMEDAVLRMAVEQGLTYAQIALEIGDGHSARHCELAVQNAGKRQRARSEAARVAKESEAQLEMAAP